MSDRQDGGGKNDAIVDGWSIECKLYRRPGFALVLEACREAETAAKPDEIPVAVVKRSGQHDTSAVVAMRLETFMAWFGPGGVVMGDPELLAWYKDQAGRVYAARRPSKEDELA